MAHAKYSPSKLPRIVTCPGSVQLCEGLTQSQSSYANEGTMLHQVVEDCLEIGELILPGTLINQYDLVPDQVHTSRM